MAKAIPPTAPETGILKDHISEKTLDDLERSYHAGTLTPSEVQTLLVEVRKGRHALTDPLYTYAGGRVSRHALLTRDATIDRFIKQNSELIAKLKKAEDELAKKQETVEEPRLHVPESTN